MADRFDILSVRETDGKSYFTKCGAMFANKKGDGFNIVMDVMPAPTDGQFRLIAKVPQPRDGARQRQSEPSNGYDDGGDIPF